MDILAYFEIGVRIPLDSLTIYFDLFDLILLLNLVKLWNTEICICNRNGVCEPNIC